MASVLLNLDAGEYPDEPEELYRLADVVHVACGGHAGDETSMQRVVRSCKGTSTRIGAHPSYVDREGFGRKKLSVAPAVLRTQIEEQCAALRQVAERNEVKVVSAKPHGALYHAAHVDRLVAEACVAGIGAALGKVTIVGLEGELAIAARSAGHEYLVEGFADRGMKADGSLIPRGEPGAMIEDPATAAAQAKALAKTVGTICVHADTASSLKIARAVKAALA